jgi:hypothetical protein
VLDSLADGGERSMDQIRSESPGLVGSYRNGIGKKWESKISIGPKMLT